MRQIILASISPRRRQVFKFLGLKFKSVDSGYKEIVKKSLKPAELVKFLALGKAKAAAKKYPKAVIIAADTMIVFKGKVIGKPKSKKDAEQMLNNFSGKSNLVITGTVILDAASKQVIVTVAETKIYFKKLSAHHINSYIESGEPFDKAGGYNPQGAGFGLIKNIEGDFTNSLGLPMTQVFNALKKLGIKN
jgi:septum formation protein